MLSFEMCQNIHADTRKLALFLCEQMQHILTKDVLPSDSLSVKKMNTTYIKPEMFTTSVAPSLTKKPLKNRKILTSNRIFKDITNPKKIRQKNEKVLVKKGNKKHGASFHCCFPKCNNTSETYGIKFERVNPPVPLLPPVGTGKNGSRALTSYYCKKILRKTILQRCGINDNGKIYRLCSNHTKENITNKDIVIKLDGTKLKITFDFLVIKPIGISCKRK